MDSESLAGKKIWLENYDEGVAEILEFDDILLPQMLKRSADKYPNNVALIFQGYRQTYSELSDMVDRFAIALSNFGIKKEDRVAILLPNIIPCVAAYYGILKIGGVVVMNCPLYSDRELLHQFQDSGVKLLITLDLLANRMIDLRGQTNIEQIIYTSIGDYLPFPQNLIFPLISKKKKLSAKVNPAQDVFRWEEIISHTLPIEPCLELTADDLAMIQYTGGTTGVAKGAKLTHGNLSYQVQQVAAWFQEFEEGEHLMMGALPFFHVFGLTTAMNLSIKMGWGNILIPRPESGKLLKAIKDFRPTFGPFVPTMYIGMLNHPDLKNIDMTCFQGLFSGSAPLPLEVIREFEEKTGAIIVEGYGLTEASPVTHINPFRGRRKVGSIGVPLPNTDCKVADFNEPGQEAKQGEPGELLIRGPQVMAGYWNQERETKRTIDNGWLRTGDVATMDDRGYFTIVERVKDMIISGGMNVYPREIDEVLFSHPKIKEASSIGVPHATRGEQIKSFIVLHDDEQADIEEILDFCKQRLAVFKIPTEIEFVNDLPRSIVGKVLKKDLRKLG